MRKISFLGIVIFLSATARSVRAIEIQYPVIPGFGNGQTLNQLATGTLSFADIFQFIFLLVLLVSGALLFASLFVAAFAYATSGANPGKRNTAKKRFVGSITGTMLLFGVFIVLRMINPDLIRLSNQTFQFCAPDCPIPEFFSVPKNSTSGGGGGDTGGSGDSGGGGGFDNGGLPPSSGTCAVATDGLCAPNNLLSYAPQFAPPGDANYASIICAAESRGGDPMAFNKKCLKTVADAYGVAPTGDYSVGLFQMNLYGECPENFQHVSDTECQIVNQTGLIACAARYGVTLSFANDPNGEITGYDVATEIRRAAAKWSNNDNKFCGPWTTAGPDTCALCPDH